MASAASTSPTEVSVGRPGLTVAGAYRSARPALSTTSCGRASYATRTSPAACAAISGDAATTAPTNCPRNDTAADWSTRSSGAAPAASRGAFSCVRTAATPSSRSAAAVSIAVIRPRATVDVTAARWSGRATGWSAA